MTASSAAHHVPHPSVQVERIAEGSAAPLRQLYRDAVARAAAWRARLVRAAASAWSVAVLSLTTCTAPQVPAEGSSGTWAQDGGVAARHELLTSLPPALLARIAAALRQPAPAGGGAGAAALAASVAAAPQAQAQALLRGALAATVAASSRRQALAGLLTAGLGNAARYVASKVSKAWRSRAGAPAAVWTKAQ